MKKSTALMAFLFSAGLIFSSCGKGEDSSSSLSDTVKSIPSESSATDSKWSAEISETANTENTPQETLPPLQSLIPDICDSRYGYYQLNADEKAVYDQIVQGIQHFQSTVTLKRKLERNTIDRIVNILRTENAELYYLQNVVYNLNEQSQIVSYLDLNYSYTQTEVEQLNTAADARISEILSMIPEGAPDITKIKIFHDQLVLNCTYNINYHYSATPYGALVAGQAVCEGYARAFAMLCNKVGIENLFAPGTYPSDEGIQQHIWNMVRLDGNWYNIDLTWDDPPKDSDGQPTPSYYIQYNYYLYRTENGDPNLTPDQSLYTLPETNSNFFNYFSYYGYYAESYDEAVDILAGQLENALKNNRKFIRVQLSSSALYEEMTQKMGYDFTNPDNAPFNKVKRYWVYHDPNLLIMQFELAELNTDILDE